MGDTTKVDTTKVDTTKKRKRLNLDLGEEAYQTLHKLAEESDKNMSEILRTALNVYKIAEDEKKRGRELAIVENEEVKMKIVTA